MGHVSAAARHGVFGSLEPEFGAREKSSKRR